MKGENQRRKHIPFKTIGIVATIAPMLGALNRDAASREAFKEGLDRTQ